MGNLKLAYEEPHAGNVTSRYMERVMTRRLYNLAMGRAIVTLRCSNDWSTHDLSAFSSLNIDRLKLIERGTASATLAELGRLSHVFQMPLKELVVLAEGLASRWRM